MESLPLELVQHISDLAGSLSPLPYVIRRVKHDQFKVARWRLSQMWPKGTRGAIKLAQSTGQAEHIVNAIPEDLREEAATDLCLPWKSCGGPTEALMAHFSADDDYEQKMVHFLYDCLGWDPVQLERFLDWGGSQARMEHREWLAYAHELSE